MKLHGEGGPLAVSDMEPLPVCDAFIAAAEQCGYRRNPDFNGAVQEGFGYYQLTTRNGRRCSAAVGYLKPARRRPNLKVVSGALATRVLFDGRRATGIEYRHAGATHTAHAREVILAGGTFNTPQLLQLSGLGPASLLRQHGIAVIADLPGVGADLQDHYHARMVYRCTQPVSVNDLLASKRRGVMAGLNYLLRRRGLLAMGAAYAGGFFRTDASRRDARRAVSHHAVLGRHDRAAAASLLRHLLSADRAAPGEPRHACASSPPIRGPPPAIQPRYLSAAKDRDTMVAGLRALRRILAAPGARALHRGRARSGPGLRVGRRSARLRAPQGLDGLSSDLDLPHGRRSGCRGRRAAQACAASTGCASSMPRSCRRSSPATPMRR